MGEKKHSCISVTRSALHSCHPGLFLHRREKWGTVRSFPSHFAVRFFCPYLPFCRAKIPSPSIIGLSYLCSSLLSSCRSRNSRTHLPACVPLPREGRACGEVQCWGFTVRLRWRGHSWVQAPCRWRGSFGMLYRSLPGELMLQWLLCCPWGCPGAPVGSLQP